MLIDSGRRLVLLTILVASGAQAHHSVAPIFDMSREITVRGVVAEYTLGNPHMRIYFDVRNEDGAVRWMAEGGSRLVLLRKGWDGRELAPGDTVSIVGNPSRDGSPVVHLTTITLPDGRELFGEDLDYSTLQDRPRRKREE